MTKRKLVINRCFGGFCLSKEAAERFGSKRVNMDPWSRSDLSLVKIVEEMGESASGSYSDLVVVEECFDEETDPDFEGTDIVKYYGCEGLECDYDRVRSYWRRKALRTVDSIDSSNIQSKSREELIEIINKMENFVQMIRKIHNL